MITIDYSDPNNGTNNGFIYQEIKSLKKAILKKF